MNRLTVAIFLILATATVPAKSEVAAHPAQVDFCGAAAMHVCQNLFQLQPGPVGTLVTLTLPEAYLHRTVTVQCVSEGPNAYYKLADNAAALCELRSCSPGLVPFCAYEIPVSATTIVGKTTKVAVPTGLLAQGTHREIVARCDIQNGDVTYAVADAGGLTCNDFACQPTQVTVCGVPVAVTQTSTLGQALTVSTPSGLSVAVQCLSSGGHAPHYVVTDHVCGG